jgi:hypothetical protein
VRVTYTGRLAREDATSASFYFADGNGDVSSLIDQEATSKPNIGMIRLATCSRNPAHLADANLIRFSGKEYHANSDLNYYGFRFCAPNLQRATCPDHARCGLSSA